MNRKFCRCHSRVIQAVVVLTTASVLSGCGSRIPDIVPISGTITIAGKPLANVEVCFIPTIDGLDGNMIGSGVTDSKGHYTIFLPGKSEAGGCACNCKVTVREGPIPDDIRDGQDSQIAVTIYKQNRRNRPIPRQYKLMGDTPLTIDVTVDKAIYDFDLKR